MKGAGKIDFSECAGFVPGSSVGDLASTSWEFSYGSKQDHCDGIVWSSEDILTDFEKDVLSLQKLVIMSDSTTSFIRLEHCSCRE